MRGAVVLTLAFVAAVFATVAIPLDFSAAQYFRSDTAVRDAFQPKDIVEPQP